MFEKGSAEFGEDYFGAKCVRGKRGRETKGNHIMLGLIKRGGKAYTQVVSNYSVNELYPIIVLRSVQIQQSTQTALKPMMDWLILTIKNTIESDW